MKQRVSFFGIFAFFFLFSFLLFLFSLKNTTFGFGILGSALFPVERVFFAIGSTPLHSRQQIAVISQKIATEEKIADYNKIKADNAAFQDQFATSQTSQLDLLPVHIIGAPSFLPGVSQPEEIVIDQGKNSGVKKGQAVIYKDVLLGTVIQVRASASLVTLLTNSAISFTARTSSTNALGIIKGTGEDDLVLDNVVLSDELRVGDKVITSMSEDISGNGYPPNLLVGEITSVDKKSSNLFQRARVKTLVDITKLTIVFVVKGTR